MYARQTRIVKIAMTSLMALVALIARGEDLAGHYILHGVMEVGSELLLKSDGTFYRWRFHRASVLQRRTAGNRRKKPSYEVLEQGTAHALREAVGRS